MVSGSKLLTAALLIGNLFAAELTLASPWINAGDSRTRHHIQYLVDTGVLNLPASSYPMPWVGVKQGLDVIKRKQLNEQQLWSVSYLQHEFQKNTVAAYTHARSHFASYQPVGQGFHQNFYEENNLNVGLQLTGEQFAMQLNGTFVNDPSDDKSARADESYIAAVVGNWAIGVGSQSRWWGPGWQSSAILSNQARPAPSIFIRRNNPAIADTPLLAMFGPWQFESFASALQQRHPDQDKPILWGTRVAFNPLQSLSLGFANTGIWAVPNLPADHDYSAADMINADDIDDDRDKMLRLHSLDVRWGFAHAGMSGAIYAQGAWQKNRSDAEAFFTGIAGIEATMRLFGSHTRLIVEAGNSIADFHQDALINKSFNSTDYQNGYRHLQSPIAQSFDADSENYSLSGQHYFSHGQALSWQWQQVRWQPVATKPNSFTDSPAQTRIARIQYRFVVSERLMAEVGASHFSHPIVFKGEDIDSGLSLSLFHHW